MTYHNFDDVGILNSGFIEISDLPANVDLAGRIRALNNMPVEIPWMWSLTLGGDVTDPYLVDLGVGVYGAMGALNWTGKPDGSLVPCCGAGAKPMLYHLAGLHDSYMPPGARVPVEVVYQAIDEFLATRQRPTCVRWQPALPFADWPPSDDDPYSGQVE